MEFAYLTRENINLSDSLFDLLVLTWAEIKGADGSVLDADSQASDDDEQRMAEAEAAFRTSVTDCWKTNKVLAGNKEIDDTVRSTLADILQRADTLRILIRIRIALSRLAADVYERSMPRPLNRKWLELGTLYRRPAVNFRAHMVSRPPPERLGSSRFVRIEDFALLPAGVRDVAVEFHEAGTCRARRDNGPLRIAIGDHCNSTESIGITELFTARNVCHPVVELRPGEGCAERLRRTIFDMNERGVHVGVLPELTMTPALLQTLRESMEQMHDAARGTNSLRIVVAGSLHERVGDRRVRNVSHVVAENGDILWSQNKMKPYAWPEARPTHREPLDTKERVLHLCDTWIGRTTVSICLDYFEDVVNELADALAVDCFFVPVMSRVTGEFGRRAWANVRALQAATFVANTSCQLAPPDPERAASMVVLPELGNEETIVKWYPLTEGCALHCVDVG